MKTSFGNQRKCPGFRCGASFTARMPSLSSLDSRKTVVRNHNFYTVCVNMCVQFFFTCQSLQFIYYPHPEYFSYKWDCLRPFQSFPFTGVPFFHPSLLDLVPHGVCNRWKGIADSVPLFCLHSDKRTGGHLFK